ncbi:DinB family protein [Halomonas organivorans]|uniref:Putative damage-inducible protein DinB n=1 Tax=Halomonas organivorans TaxID=257772 RepID=A0A7W5BWA0_9GAMM|nr:DinB family protein [Halomonas organivorans]MBB3139823.1 putative damage-inducible protein DinB [Halomonas organivorans]
MTLKCHLELLASYNQWMNAKVYEAASRLSPEELARDRGAFFDSILGTLNHIVVADTIWLQRFATHPACVDTLREIATLPTPTRLDEVIFRDFQDLYGHRIWLDERIIHWIDGLEESDLDWVLDYHNVKGMAASRRFSSLLLHFFNHQTHHRGQVTTLLSQAGEDVGTTDLLALIPEEPAS